MNSRLIDWLFENLGLVIVLAITAFSFLRGMFRAGKANESEAPPRSRMRDEEDPEAAERTRRIQEQIRRKIAERQGRTVPMEVQEEREVEVAERRRGELPPLLPPTRVPPVDPFGGSMRKILRKIEEAAEQRRETMQEDVESMESASLRRQRELEEQLRAVEAQRVEARRRAQEVAAREIGAGAQKNVWASPSAGVGVAGAGVREELRDPRALRRAFVLREVLGPPVGLR